MKQYDLIFVNEASYPLSYGGGHRPRRRKMTNTQDMLICDICRHLPVNCRFHTPSAIDGGSIFVNRIIKKKIIFMATMQKITSNLWFDNEAEEAANYYTSIFKNSRIGKISRYGKEGYEIHKRPEGSVMVVQFYLEGQEFIALNGGPLFKFNEAISFIVNCGSQEEVDYYWDKLKEGGDEEAQICGWLKDKFGLSWQVVPAVLSEMISDPDPKKSQPVMKALLQMKKIVIGDLEKAYTSQSNS
jgi:predicted 3-demethylubiquinone-9 3-methyltransferase (glyoxalase superfamily)